MGGPMTARVRLICDGQGVAELSLVDKENHNALSEELVAELLDALESLAQDPCAKVVVLGGLPDIFCSGASRELLFTLASGTRAPADILLSKRLLDLQIPSIAAMEGHAIGGGFALGLSADIVLLARESRYGCNFMDMGFTPGMGITRLMEHVLSPALAHELMFTGELRRGSEFAGKSGVNYVLPKLEIRPRALDLASRIAEKPRTALTLLKRTLSLPRRQSFEASLTMESLMHEITFVTPEVRRRIEEEYAAN